MMSTVSKSILMIALGFGSAIAAAPAFSQEAVAVQTQVVSHYVVHKGTREFNQVRQFLARSSEGDQRMGGSAANLDPENLGDLYVTVTRNTSGAGNAFAATAVPPPPPWTPPSVGAHIGDTATVQSCNAGTDQTWKLEYKQITPTLSGWVTVNYSYAKKMSCSVGGV